MVQYEQLIVDEEPGVVTVTLNRPEKLNSYTLRLGLELRHAIGTADARDDVRAIVVTGAGRAFCAGADLSGGSSSFGGGGNAADARKKLAEEFRIDAPQYWEMNTPIIAALNGHAIGVGLTIPMQFDVRYVAEDAKLAFAFNRRGVAPELNSAFIVPRVIGLSRAFELMVSGRTILGTEAAEYGLASKALPADEVLPAAMELARDIAVNTAPVSAALTKRMIYAATDDSYVASDKISSKVFQFVAAQPDSSEGPAAFIEKRDPQWKLSKNSDFPSEIFDD